jgi:hypothetical protein
MVMSVSCVVVTQKVANFSEELATFCDYTRNKSSGQNWLETRKKERAADRPNLPPRKEEGRSIIRLTERLPQV